MTAPPNREWYAAAVDETVIYAACGVLFVALTAFFAVLNARDVRSLMQIVEEHARAAGLSDVRRTFPLLFQRVIGTRNGRNVTFTYFGRQKHVPSRLRIDIATQAEGRLEAVARRPPLLLFGPPAVEEPRRIVSGFFLRSDSPMLTSALFSDDVLAEELRREFVSSFDRLSIKRGRIRIERALDEKATKRRYGRGFFSWRFDEASFRDVLQKAWTVATLTQDRLGR